VPRRRSLETFFGPDPLVQATLFDGQLPGKLQRVNIPKLEFLIRYGFWDDRGWGLSSRGGHHLDYAVAFLLVDPTTVRECIE
jgi:hypothetical protein